MVSRTEHRLFVLRIMALVLVGLQIGDVLATNYSMADPAIVEANPIVRYFMHHLGWYWWLPKFAIAFAIMASVLVLTRVSIVTFVVMVVVIVFYGAIIMNNVFHIAFGGPSVQPTVAAGEGEEERRNAGVKTAARPGGSLVAADCPRICRASKS